MRLDRAPEGRILGEVGDRGILPGKEQEMTVAFALVLGRAEAEVICKTADAGAFSKQAVKRGRQEPAVAQNGLRRTAAKARSRAFLIEGMRLRMGRIQRRARQIRIPADVFARYLLSKQPKSCRM